MDGEFDLIERLRAVLDAAGAPDAGADRVVLGSGDDAAVTIPGGATATSVDSLVEGVHFRRETAPLRSVGRKAVGAALSDLAAMGAAAGEVYVQLGVPAGIDAEAVIELAEGLGAAAAENGARVLGGDVSRAPVVWVGVTVVGHASRAGDLVSRAGAMPGDALVVTGELGGAAAGLLLLERPDLGAALAPEVARALRARQLEPAPRLAAGVALARSGARAMIDLSDGLAGDAAHVARASSARLVVELGALPVAAGVAAVAAAAGLDATRLATAGGEDYELLAALPPARMDEAIAAVGSAGLSLTPVGRVEEGAGTAFIDLDGAQARLDGFDQLRAPRSPPEPA